MRQSFTSGQVMALAKVSTYQTLDYWIRSGFIKPSVPAQGKGTVRLFSFRDVVALRVVAQLREAQVSLQSLRKVAQRIRSWRGIESTSDALASTRIVLAPDGDVLVVESDAALVSALRRPGQQVFHVVALSDVVAELQREVAKLEAA